ncbi:hypothetical protein [Parabacteroides sp. FAFU027]|uniref:hypothetical protein n=1 Tax=Parabacteroides sp. FAFU027 TaxID=2922715 RepID=UPI001FAFDDF7|nr:hypothetical protein [Parabacteroides sp. FAFU027]
MKKNNYFLIFLLLIGANTFAQNAFYDATELSKALNSNKKFGQNQFTILYMYYPEKSDNEIAYLLTQNHFLKNYFDPACLHAYIPSPYINKFISSFGDLDVTNFADGMAKFIVKRTKQELSITFFERFKEELDNTPQAEILFPATYNALKAIDREIYNYSAYLDLLRESFQKDLALLLPNLERLVNSDCMKSLFSEYPEVKTILSNALFITNEFREGKHPGDIVHNYATLRADKNSLDRISPDLYPSLRVIDLFSQSLRSRQTGHYWLSQDSVMLLYKDPVLLNIYLGLIYQQVKQIDPQMKINNDTILPFLKEIQKNTSYLNALISKANNANYYFNAIKEKQIAGKDKPTYQDYYSLYDATVSLLEYVNQLPSINNKIDQSYFKAAHSVGNMYVDIYEKQYTSAIVELSSYFSDLNSKHINQQIQEIDDSIKALNDTIKKKVKKEIIKELENEKRELEKMQQLSSFLVKYGTFAATVAKAENSDEVAAAIEAVALPAGSSRVKRESNFNVSLNAYCGGYWGYEKIKDVDNGHREVNFRFKNWNSYGISAPIGFAASMGHSFPFGSKARMSSSIFFSVIDIGTLAAFRFDTSNDSVGLAPKIQLKDIISPGIFYSIGLPKCPISINVGYQVGPLLRKVTSTQNEYNNKYSRFSVSLCVDIPILNLYNKSR